MKYKIVFSREAEKAVLRLNSSNFKAISAVVDSLEEEPWPNRSVSLRGTYKENLYKIRVRDFRIIYSVDSEYRIVYIKRIARRSEKTYRNL
jgi:mRNA interferase RelE/StbE